MLEVLWKFGGWYAGKVNAALRMVGELYNEGS
jgi:hypothetical protein